MTQISHNIYFVDAFCWKHGHSNVPTVRWSGFYYAQSPARQSAKCTSYLNHNVVISHTHQIYEPNKKLAAWVRAQRTDYKNQRIAQEKVDLLESIGFVWSVLVRNTWEEMYAKLKAYREVVRIYVLYFVNYLFSFTGVISTITSCCFVKHGHCNVSCVRSNLTVCIFNLQD